MNLTIVACANAVPQQPYLVRGFNAFKESCRNFGFEPLILGWGEPWGGLGSKPKLLKRAIESGKITSEFIIFADAFDVVFSRNPSEILDSWVFEPRYDDIDITWNAELCCFPNYSYAESHPETSSRFRYLNSGLSVGVTEAYLHAVQQMNVDSWLDDHRMASGAMYERNDQNDWMEKFLFGQCAPEEPRMTLDTECRLFQTICGTDESNFDVETLHNKECGSYPGAWHFNGPGKSHPLFDKILTKLGY